MEKAVNAVELWAESLKSKPIRPCTEYEAEDFIRWTIIEMRREAEVEKELEKLLDEGQGGVASAFWFRVKNAHTYRVTPTVAAFLGNVVLANFGISTMMANYLQYWAHRNHWPLISMMELAAVFPNGFPTPEAWSESWSENKIEVDPERGFTSDNGLDYPALMDSIREIAKDKK